MLTNLVVRNFKQFDEVEIELGNPVVFVGPNDSGKTSALQVLTLWDLGLRRWLEKRGGGAPEERPGVAINRRDLTGIPAPSARQIWRDLHVRDAYRDHQDRQRTENVRVEVVVDGVSDGSAWSCGLEFDYANEDSYFERLNLPQPPAQDRLPPPGRTRCAPPGRPGGSDSARHDCHRRPQSPARLRRHPWAGIPGSGHDGQDLDSLTRKRSAL
ncbi:MAG: AAA family ATPase [Acidimicrobiales bacterium]